MTSGYLLLSGVHPRGDKAEVRPYAPPDTGRDPGGAALLGEGHSAQDGQGGTKSQECAERPNMSLQTRTQKSISPGSKSESRLQMGAFQFYNFV